MSISTQATSSSTYNTQNQLQNSNGVLDRDAFMQLLVAQLQHQDPLEPTGNQEFAAQLAQYSSLEAVNHLSEQFSAFVTMQQRTQWTSQLGQSTGLIGKTVDLAVEDGVMTGKVSAVRVVDGAVMLVVNGENYDIACLQEVRE